jgi:hypothetical protein
VITVNLDIFFFVSLDLRIDCFQVSEMFKLSSIFRIFDILNKYRESICVKFNAACKVLFCGK